VVVCPSDASNEVKLRVKICSGELASLLKLDGAVVASQAGGSNFDIDFFFLLAELEDRGIKTIGHTGGHNGKSMLDPKGNAIVMGGDSGTIIELPPMDLVIGDLESAVRDFYYGAWSVHDEYGPSLRPDGSLIVNGCMIADCTNNNGFTTKTVKDF
jgi:glycine reductase